MSVPALVAFENGDSMPSDQRGLLAAVIAALDPTPGELAALIRAWALAVISEDLGEDLAREILADD